MKHLVIFLIISFATAYTISDSDAFFEEGIVVEVPGQIMELSDNVISPGQTMFVNGTFNQSADGFTANIFKNYENSRELVLTLSPTSNEFGDFSFNFTIPQDWELGNYHIVLENGIQEMHWQFTVRKNHSGATLDSTVYPIIPPLKQIQSGISFDEIQCKDNLVLIQKYDKTPACVTESTKTKLIERGWTAKDLPFNIITQDSSDATFYVQSLLNGALLKQGTTIHLTLFSYIKDSPSEKWDHVFDRAFKEVPERFEIGIVQNSPENIKLFATSGKQILPAGLNAELIRDGGYFVVVLSSEKSLTTGEYDLVVVTVEKETGMTIVKPVYLHVVKESESDIRENIIQIQHSKHPWGIYLENISEQEYWIREDERLPSPPNPVLEINDSNIHPHVKNLIDVMWSTDAEYVPSKYDKNTLLVENVSITNVEPSEIRDWMKNTSEQQFYENLDGSTTHYFKYDDRLYSVVFSIAD